MKIFTWFADWIIYGLFSMDPELRLSTSLHFFIEDVSKIYVLVVIMIYVIGLLRAGFDSEKARDYLKGKPRFVSYAGASALGAVTPFCSCSSIPLFLGFTSAGIPVGTTMAF